MMLLQNLGFDARYEVEESASQFDDSVSLRFHPERNSHSAGLVFEPRKSCACFRVTPEDYPPWKGSFEGGPGGLDGLFSTPSPNVICIVVKGCGYWVDVARPENFEVVVSSPITEVVPIPSRGLLVFVDHVRVSAYSSKGLLWETESLSWDGIKISGIDEVALKGEAWDSPLDRHVPFLVNLTTGEATGGSSSDKYDAW